MTITKLEWMKRKFAPTPNFPNPIFSAAYAKLDQTLGLGNCLDAAEWTQRHLGAVADRGISIFALVFPARRTNCSSRVGRLGSKSLKIIEQRKSKGEVKER